MVGDSILFIIVGLGLLLFGGSVRFVGIPILAAGITGLGYYHWVRRRR